MSSSPEYYGSERAARGLKTSRQWPFSVSSYMPHLDDGGVAHQSLKAFEAFLLSDETLVRRVSLQSLQSPNVVNDETLDAEGLSSRFNESPSNRHPTATTSEIFFVNRYLVKEYDTPPEDSNMLRLSKEAFRLLQSKFQFSPTFISSLANLHKPVQKSIPHSSQVEGTPFNYWVIIPVRVQVQCFNKKKSHVASTAGRSQMNPLNYLHLSGPGIDIRGSHIAIHYCFNKDAKLGSTVVFNFQDGRWWKIIEEPVSRIKESMTFASRNGYDSEHDPFHTQAVFLTSALRWWGNALNSFNDQLIAYEESLLVDQQPIDDEFKLNSETNRALHCMAAHLHRYSSDLALIEEIVDDVRKYNSAFHESFVKLGLRAENEMDGVTAGIEQIASQVSTLRSFRNELQLNTDNVLALLVDKTQAMNDLLLVQNGKSMQEILHATQAEAERSRQIAAQSQSVAEQMHLILQATEKEARNSGKIARQSQRLSKEMKKDSVAMKTIALLTTFFLPGTSFAAILSMPFFVNSDWMKEVSTFWLWVVLTVPATTICFLFYMTWSRMENHRKQREIDEDEEHEMEPTGVA